MYETDKTSSTSSQADRKPSPYIIWGEVTVLEGLPSQENKAQAEARAVKTERLVLEEPDGSAMGSIFTEIQQLAGTGPNSQLIKVS